MRTLPYTLPYIPHVVILRSQLPSHPHQLLAAPNGVLYNTRLQAKVPDMQWQPSQQPAPMYSMNQQQAYPSYDNAGQQWQHPQQSYQNNAPPQSYQNNAPQQSYQSQSQQSSSVIPNIASETRTISGEADGVRYTILYRGGLPMPRAACRALSPRVHQD